MAAQASSALQSRHQRALLEEFNKVANELRSLPNDHANAYRACLLLLSLTQLLARMKAAVAAHMEQSQQAMWTQRTVWLQDEIVTLIAEKLQSADAQTFWNNAYLLLEVGAEASERALSKKDHVPAHAWALSHSPPSQEIAERELHIARTTEAALQERLASYYNASSSAMLQGRPPGHAPAEDLKKDEEVLALRTRLMLTQQELQQQRADASDLYKQLQTAIAERMVGQDQQDAAEVATTKDQVVAYQQSLEAHMRVIEQLTVLNTELMDAANARAAIVRGGTESHQPHRWANRSTESQDRHAVLQRSLSGELPLSIRPQHSPLAHGSMAADLSNMLMSPLAQSPSSSAPHAAAVSPSQRAGPADSGLVAAFESFLVASAHAEKGEETTSQLTAPRTVDQRAIVIPMAAPTAVQAGVGQHLPAAESKQNRNGLVGLVLKAASLVLYVAGDDAAKQERAQEMRGLDIV